MSRRMPPPGRASHSWTRFVKNFGPHHRARCCGSVHARNTSARGASNTRVRTTSRSDDVAGSLLAAILPFLLLEFLEVLVEAVEALLPEPLERLDPVVDRLEPPGVELVQPAPPRAADADQPHL